jgi:hypothetical protein
MFRRRPKSKLISLGDRARIEIPSFATASYDKEVRGFVIGLGGQPSSPPPAATEMLISEYPISDDSSEVDEADLVADLAQEFLSKCAKVESFNVFVSESDNVCVAQGVGYSGGEQYWIVRMICKRSAETFWLLHWNGPEALAADVVLPILESFELET